MYTNDEILKYEHQWYEKIVYFEYVCKVIDWIKEWKLDLKRCHLKANIDDNFVRRQLLNVTQVYL